jgi:succinate dehydrogenase hydrophobic anchor subunit
MKDQDTERARQERDSVLAGMVAAVAVVAAVLFMLGLALPAGGRAVLLVVVAALAVAAVVKHVRDGD